MSSTSTLLTRPPRPRPDPSSPGAGHPSSATPGALDPAPRRAVPLGGPDRPPRGPRCDAMPPAPPGPRPRLSGHPPLHSV